MVATHLPLLWYRPRITSRRVKRFDEAIGIGTDLL